jgi:hypothetical protein
VRQGGAHGGFPPLGGTARGVLRLVEFITDGRLGPTGQEVADALEEASEGQPEALAILLSEDPESTACEILARTSVHVDASSLEEVIARFRRCFPIRVPQPMRAARPRTLSTVCSSGCSGAREKPTLAGGCSHEPSSPGFWGVPADQPTGARWPRPLRDRYLDAASSRELGQFAESLVGTRMPSMPLIRPAEDITTQPRPVTDLIRGTGPSVLAGRTGMGKSTAAELLRREGARQGRAVLVAHGGLLARPTVCPSRQRHL